MSSSEHTLNTLRYSDRVKELKKGGKKKETKEERFAREMMFRKGTGKKYEFG